jgi:hypothetical protein
MSSLGGDIPSQQPGTEPSPARRQDELTVLLTDYESARGDERNHTLAIAALFTIEAAIVLGEASQFLRSCHRADCTPIPGWLFALAPVPAWAVIALMALVGTEATMRYAYMTALEYEIEARLVPDAAEPADVPRLRMLQVPFMFFQRARAPVVVPGAQSSRWWFPFPFLFGLMVAGVVATVLPLTVYSLIRVGPWWASLLVGIPYVLGLAILGSATVLAWGTFGWDKRIWREALHQSPDSQTGFPRYWR